MIVSRLATAARAVIKEFQDSKIIDLLNTAKSYAAQRGAISNSEYKKAVSEIRNDAARIVSESRLDNIAPDIKHLFTEGAYWNALPSKLADTILTGVLFDKNASMSSNELELYVDTANRLLGNLNNMLGAFDALSVEEIVVPSGTVSLDFFLPRSAFDNSASGYVTINSAFIDVVSYIEELVTGSKGSPELVYTSTSDPVTGIAVLIAATTPILLYYEKILDVAKKQIDLLKAVKSMRDAFPGIELPAEANVTDKVKELTRKAVEDATKAIASDSASSPSNGRQAEITNAITIRSSTLVTAIANGARVKISLESQATIEQDLSDNPLDIERLAGLLASIKPSETVVSDSLKLLDHNVPMLELVKTDNE